MEDLAKRTGLTVHLGVFEGDMVTYLVKAAGVTDVLTQEGMQLEAYCSGIGKVLLAFLPLDEREQYLAGGPFVRLTAHHPHRSGGSCASSWRTFVATATPRTTARSIQACNASPRPVWVDGDVCAAVSISASDRDGPPAAGEAATLPLLKETVGAIQAALKRPSVVAYPFAIGTPPAPGGRGHGAALLRTAPPT